MNSNNFKINRRTPAIYIGNESVNLVWKKNIEIEERTKENTTRLDGVEGVANDAADLSHSNREMIGEIEGTANEANQRSKDNTGRLDIVQGVANEANERSKSNLTRLDSVDGTAKAAKALAESNQKLLSTVEGTANGAKALATECRTLIDGKANVEQLTYSNVHLKVLGRELYIVAPTGLLSDDDIVFFSRYVRSSGREPQSEITGKRAHYRNTGWLAPVRYYNEKGAKKIVPMVMRKDDSLSNDFQEYFLLQTSAGSFYKARPTFSADIADAFLRCYAYCYNTLSFNLHLFDKKMGVCVRRNGKQLTSYLPFTVRFHNVTTKPSEEDPTKNAVDISNATAYLSRWI